MRGIFAAALALLGLLANGSFAAFDSAEFNAGTGPLQITRITPAGEDVPASRQIVFSFNRPVVPVGRMERDAAEIPVTIEPALDCEWRWLNTSALACQLTERAAMQPATRYRLTMQPGIQAEDGATLAAPVVHEFITQRPKLEWYQFHTWRAPGSPQIRVVFNQEVTRASVAEALQFRQGGTGYPVQVENLPYREATDTDRGWLVSPVTELPMDADASLHIAPGVVPAQGSERGIEQRLVVAFNTFPAFRFLGLRCQDNSDRPLTIAASDDTRRCNPMANVGLIFSTPVIKEELKAHARLDPDLAGGREDYDPWANTYGYSRLNQPHRRGAEYIVWLPENLKAFETYRLSIDAALRDEFGRALPQAVDAPFLTDHRKPDFTLTHPVSVLESAIDSETPIVLNNIDALTLHYDALTPQGARQNQTRQVGLPAIVDIAYRHPLGVRELLDGQSGFVMGRVDTRPPVSKGDQARRFHAQVTPFGVHAKAGHYNTLVWVTRLDDGQPVKDAKVTLLRTTFPGLATGGELLGEARTDAEGVAMLAGLNETDPRLEAMHNWDDSRPHLFARIEQGGEMALLPLSHDYQTEPYWYGGDLRQRYGHLVSWGTTAQGVYKAGDTIQYKLYVRDQDNRSLVPAPRGAYTLKVVDPTGKTVHEEPDLTLNDFGAHHGEFTVSKNGAVGWYRFTLDADFDNAGELHPLRVLVSDFTPSPFRVSTTLNGEDFRQGDTLKVDTLASLHAGGPYADAEARITVQVNARSLNPRDPLAARFHFDTYVMGQPERETLHEEIASVNAQGEHGLAIALPEARVLYGNLLVESAVRDDRGKYVGGFANAAYAGRDRYVGLKSEHWVQQEDEPASVQTLVVDHRGEPVADTPVEIVIRQRVTKATRVKGAGNAYLTRYVHEWEELSRCTLTPGTAGGDCAYTPQNAGLHQVVASIVDTRGLAHSTTLNQWVVGKGQVVWEDENDNRVDIVPEKDSYRVGDTARYLVKNPFPGAQALVSVERYGVIERWVQPLAGSTPVIEFTVTDDMLPGFYLSVTAMSPRVEKPMGEDGALDLGKPAMRTGWVQTTVMDDSKRLKVRVTPAAEEYRPRDTVHVTLAAAPVFGANDQPVELAVIALDESVFDLIQGGAGYFDPYPGFYRLEGRDLRDFNLLMRLVGRQLFEKKGANAGGDGGDSLQMRSVFKYVGYWNPSLVLQPGEQKTVEFQVPDNLTGWRVLALAATPGDRLGLGQGTFRVNRPTELRPVMPNQVLAGDRFQAGFSVMNRTDRSRELNVTIHAEGPLAGGVPLVTRRITAEPYARHTVYLPVATTRDGELRFTASAGDASDRDVLQHRLPVQRRGRLETAATYGATEAGEVVEAILFPEGMRGDTGRVGVTLAPSVIGNVEGAFEYMRDYPYSCWEQKLSKGTMASHYNGLRSWLPDALAWEDAPQLPARILGQAADFQAPNGGMTYFVPQDQYVSPYLSAYTALAFNWLRNAGEAVPAEVERRLHDYLDTLLRKDVTPSFYSTGMQSTVRAVALAALAPHGRIDRSDIERYHRHVPDMSLFGKAMYLQAALAVEGTEAIRAEVTDTILAHANQTGGKFIFSESLDDGYTRILATPLRDNCAILSTLTAYGETEAGGARVADVPYKLVRTITQTRGARTHWENTQENLFCMNALIDYSRVYEPAAPNMQVQAWLNEASLGEAVFNDRRDPPVALLRSVTPDDPGTRAEVKIQRQGEGRLYYSARLDYAFEDERAEPVNSGIEIRREYSVERDGQWVLLGNDVELQRGELVRVDLYVSLPTARNFVVVDDPVPGGLEPVNRDLATASVIDAQKGEFQAAGGSWWYQYDDWHSYGYSRWSFYHQELRHDAVRFYSDYLSAGNYHLSYVAQAIAPGAFSIQPVKAEEMYDPDVYGLGVPGSLGVGGDGAM